MAASHHGDTPHSGKPVTLVPVTPYTTSVDVNLWRVGHAEASQAGRGDSSVIEGRAGRGPSRMRPRSEVVESDPQASGPAQVVSGRAVRAGIR